MTNISSSRRYAQAIVAIADGNDSLAQWRNDLEVLDRLWSNDAVRAYFEDVHVSQQGRSERARSVLGSRIDPLALNFVLLLIARGRTYLIPYIARQFDDILRERERQIEVQVTSSQPLTDRQRADLITHLQADTGKEVSLVETVDPAILGGLVIRIGDQLMDLSIAGRLRRLREQVVGRMV